LPGRQALKPGGPQCHTVLLYGAVVNPLFLY